MAYNPLLLKMTCVTHSIEFHFLTSLKLLCREISISFWRALCNSCFDML